jgi:hypothetical protein
MISLSESEPIPTPPITVTGIGGEIDCGIYFREDDYLMVPPYPTPDPADSTIGGKVDIEARMMDFNGESGHPDQNEYSPFHFDDYGYDSIEYSTIFGKGVSPEYAYWESLLYIDKQPGHIRRENRIID